MVVRRASDAESDFDQIQLGRLLVTIDDLRALQQIMAERDHLDQGMVKFEFGRMGSTMSTPEEIRELSEGERHELEIRSLSAVVSISPYDSLVYGNSATCAHIKRGWADSRQTNRRPFDVWPRPWLRLAWLSFLITLMAAIYNLAGIVVDLTRGRSIQFWTVASEIVVAIVLASSYWIVDRATRNCAVIVPLTLAEDRERQVASGRYRFTTVVAVVGLLCSLTLGVITEIRKN